MKSKGELQLSPNGNGALFDSINTNSLVKRHIQSVDYVQVIGVDNVLNKLLDPIQVGITAAQGLEASLKVCVKRDAAEKVGVVCKKNGKYDIVEYSELSEELANKPKPDGNYDELYFELGNILIFMMSSKRLIQLSMDTASLNKLYHLAHKKVEYFDKGT